MSALPPTLRPTPQRGMLLIPVAVLVVFLGGLSLALFEAALGEQKAVVHQETRLRALAIAETAALRAQAEIEGGNDVDGDGLGTISGSFAGGTYDVQATQDAGDSRLWVLRVRGTHGYSTRVVEVGLRTRSESLFTHALFGRDEVKLTGGSWTDGYDSRLGTYASQAVNVDAWGPYATGGAHVGSNTHIVVGGGAVRGDAVPGPLDWTEISGGGIVWGDTDPRSEDLVIPDPPFQEFADAFASNDNLSIDVSNPKVSYDPVEYELLAGGGAPIELTGGTYIFNVLKMTGGGNLIISGPSKIYITNYLEISGGGIVNLTGIPSNCQIISHPYDFPAGSKHDKMYVKTSGGSDTRLTVYAPTNHFEVSGGGDLYGSAISNTAVLSGGSGFHYDRALLDLGGGGGSSGVERMYWREASTPAP